MLTSALAAAGEANAGTVFLWEFLGTMFLLLLGAGVVANVILPKTKGHGGGWLLINFGWGLAVFVGVYVAAKTGAHLNPAVTLGLLAGGAESYAPGIDVNFGNTLVYIAAQFVGAFTGAVLAWLAYKDHFDQDADPAVKLGVFSTGPELRNPIMNLVTEIIGTFVLVFWIFVMPWSNAGRAEGMDGVNALGPLAVALVVLAIGASLGGPTGYAINPARDLGPRIAHFILPIPGKGHSDWGYAWVPVVGPIIGGILAGLLWQMVK